MEWSFGFPVGCVSLLNRRVRERGDYDWSFHFAVFVLGGWIAFWGVRRFVRSEVRL